MHHRISTESPKEFQNKSLVKVDISKNLKLFSNYPLLFDEASEVVLETDYDDSFHIAFRPVATFVQFLFLMPVCGISSDNSDDLVFKWKSFRVMMTLLYFLYGVFVTFVYFKHWFSNKITIGSSIGLIFFSYTAACTIIFLNVARAWPSIMKMWKKIDEKFTKKPYKIHKSKLSTKIRITAVTLITLAFLEHFLFLGNCIFSQYVEIKMKGIKIDEPIAYFFKNQFDFLYTHLPFSVPMGFFNEAMNMTFTFGWNYMELFVMIISLGLSTRFQQINDRVEQFRGKIVSEQTWINVHKDYASLCELVEKIDHELRYLILMSNLNNLCFICFQLYHIFETLPYTINTIYFWCSFLYLFGRTLVAQYMAAKIHDASQYPVEVIKSIPPEGWCIEMQRISDEARSQTIALSGMKFFYLTRRTILVMLATIVAYELVLWQITNAKKALKTNRLEDFPDIDLFS